ncbi:hypothetical protein B0H11DRAFT_2192665 [Mycena galericulata]|nr:hypothetical protein B0H11DRAFT_2192665 [Mycena galericulata]
MAEIALINIDKREVVDPSETGYGYKMKEAIANRMSLDIVWLFSVPADAQAAPAPLKDLPTRFGRVLAGTPKRVPVGHWAGDRVLIVDEYSGYAKNHLPVDLIAKYPDADPEDNVLWFALENLKHVSLPGYKHEGAEDALFPTDRVWVVRNLTKGWYARSDTLVPAKFRRGPHIARGLGLGDLIWADVGGSMAARMGAGGRGDRFDIQTLDAVENTEDGKEWKNLSKEAKRCLAAFDMHDDVQEHLRPFTAHVQSSGLARKD